jgi:hypothetical protein
MNLAINALYGAIIFLMESGFKYVAMIKDVTFLSFIYNKFPKIIYIPKIFAFICLIIASMQFYNTIFHLLRMILSIKEENWSKKLKAH